jgi:hydrogenase expression/formation protein HypC
VVDDARPPETLLNQWVLVHVGFALSRIDPDEARRTLELLEGVDLADDELDMLRAEATREGHAVP